MEQQIITEKQDMKYLSWDMIRSSSGTAGSFLKTYSDYGKEKIYYKLSNYDAYRGIIGHECVNEIIVDRLLTVLGIEHLRYQLIHAEVEIGSKIYDTYLCGSKDYKNRGESKIALDAFYQIACEEGETPLDFCIRNGWSEYIYNMLVVDFLICNRDRHGANIEVLRNRENRTIRLAPLFDHGLSLIFQCTNQAMLDSVDVMEDKAIQCFVGSKSAYDNLKLIPRGQLPIFPELMESDKQILFENIGDEIMPTAWRELIWEMIWRRWKYYANLCNSR